MTLAELAKSRKEGRGACGAARREEWDLAKARWHKGTKDLNNASLDPASMLRRRASMLRNATHGTAAGQVTQISAD